MKNIIKTTLIICGMAFLFASCSEYKVLETTEVFKIEKTSSENSISSHIRVRFLPM